MFKDHIKTGKKRILFLISMSLALVFTMSSFYATPVSALRSDSSYEGVEVILGGMPFGVKFSTEGVVVLGFSDIDGISKTQNPAYVAGIRPKDVIIKVNGKAIKGADELTSSVEASQGREITLTYKRGGSEKTVRLTPIYSTSECRYKTGIWVKDSGAGIGTVTYIMPDDYSFGGLGHGICDGETGELVCMRGGDVMNVTVNAVKKGVSGAPGELKGYFDTVKIGSLQSNTECGIFGRFSSLPKGCGERIAVGTRDEIKEGAAQIVCTLSNGVKAKYNIEISGINREANGSKCFVVKVKDESLISKTGGIVQGMSGSPIIQNGKLVGAVTHVMINDPTTGYGIFIENMLNASAITIKTAA